jgi:hypothetical protein
MFDKLHVASPCNANWEQMVGDDRVRWCSQCNLNVYNFSALSKRELSQLIREKEGLRLCGRLYRRADGTLITKDCEGGTRTVVRRVSRLVIASLAAAMGSGIAMAQTPEPQSLVQISEAQSGIDVTVLDATGAPIPGTLVWIRSGILKQPITGTTNEKGEWQFRGLEPARYQIQVQAPGHQPSTQIVSIADHTVSGLQIQLEDAAVMGEVVLIRHRNPLKRLFHRLVE